MTEPPKGKASITQMSGGLLIVMPPPRRWFMVAGLAFYVAFWVGFPLVVFGDAGWSGAFSVWIVVFVAVWLYCGAVCAYLSLWLIAGREVVIIDETALATRQETPMRTRSETYDIRDVHDLRATSEWLPEPPTDSWFWRIQCSPERGEAIWGLAGGHIAFDYHNRTHRFAAGLDEAEAQQIVARIIERFPSLGESGQA
jgi:hypothetical protein